MADDDIRATLEHHDEERDEFILMALPLLLGECRRGKDNSPWCYPHDSMWIVEQGRCHYINDRDEFGDRLIEMWEGRHGR